MDGAQEWWKMHWTVDIGTIQRRRTSWSLMLLFLPCVGDIAPCRIRLCFITLLVLRFINRSSWSSNLSGCSKWNTTSLIPMSRTLSNSKLDWSLALSKMIFSWMIEQDGYIKSHVRSYWHGVEMDNTILVLDRPWRGMSAIRAPGRIHEGTPEATMIGLDDRRRPKSTFGKKWTIYKRYLGESSKNLQRQGKRLTFIKS
jgi:hypothetical protein